MRRMSSDWRSARWQLNDLRSVDSVSINQTALFCSPPLSPPLPRPFFFSSRHQFLPPLVPDPPSSAVLSLLHPPSPPPRRLLPAPPISSALRLIRLRQQSWREFVFEGCLHVVLRKKTTDRSSLDRSEARCCFCVFSVQFVFLCLCAASPRRCHLRSASLEVPQGPRRLPGVVLTRLAFGGLVL